MTINERVSEQRLLFRLQDFYGAEQDAEQIGDYEYAEECRDIVSVIRELQQYRAAAVPVIPDGLHPATADLVLRFATALAEKLHKAEQKYGYSDNWQRNDWYDDCLQSLWEHIEKGDPRDVAAYCAFMWYHGWVTTDYDRGVQKAVGSIAAPQVTSVPTFDDLRDAVAEMTGGIPQQWTGGDKGHQAVPFMNFNTLGRIVDKFRAVPEVQAEQCNHQVIPAGYALVPIEPTESMIINGFESEPDSFFSDPKSWAAYQAMSGCQQAAHRAKLCWAAMVKTALQQEKG